MHSPKNVSSARLNGNFRILTVSQFFTGGFLMFNSQGKKGVYCNSLIRLLGATGFPMLLPLTSIVPIVWFQAIRSLVEKERPLLCKLYDKHTY